MQWKIHWKGYAEEEATWHFEEDLRSVNQFAKIKFY